MREHLREWREMERLYGREIAQWGDPRGARLDWLARNWRVVAAAGIGVAWGALVAVAALSR